MPTARRPRSQLHTYNKNIKIHTHLGISPMNLQFVTRQNLWSLVNELKCLVDRLNNPWSILERGDWTSCVKSSNCQRLLFLVCKCLPGHSHKQAHEKRNQNPILNLLVKRPLVSHRLRQEHRQLLAGWLVETLNLICWKRSRLGLLFEFPKTEFKFKNNKELNLIDDTTSICHFSKRSFKEIICLIRLATL